MMDLLQIIQDIDAKSQHADGISELVRDLATLGDGVIQAVSFATMHHSGQRRKYIDVPYVSHSVAVASIVRAAGGSTAMVKAAILHDVVEDTDATIMDVQQEFGTEVASLVDDLTDISDPYKGQPGWNRAKRKALDRDHTAAAHPDAKTVKLADLIHNAFSIRTHDPGFARKWLKEKRALLQVLTDGHVDLHALAIELAKQ